MTPFDEAQLDELTARAGAGDQAALAELFERLRPLLVRIARREIGRAPTAAADPDDIASDVMLRLIDQFRNGKGPKSNPVAYLARAIRNRVIDIHRSARSARELTSDDFETLSNTYDSVSDGAEQRTVDARADLAIVRRALARLPESQQSILTAIAVDGMKPSVVADLLDIAPNTVSVRAGRARKALAVELRMVLLEEASGDEHCERNRRGLSSPAPYPVAVDEHLGTCRKCAAALRRYAALPSLLAAVPLAALAEVVGEESSASAATSTAQDERPPTRTGRRTKMRRAAVAAAAVLVILVAIPLMFSRPPAPDRAGSPARPSVPTSAPAQPGPSTPEAGEPAWLAGDFTAPADLTVLVEEHGPMTVVIVSFALVDGAQIDQVDVALPSSMRIANSDGWECESELGGGSCRPSTDDASVLRFEIISDRAPATGPASLVATIRDDGIVETARTDGTLRVVG